MTENTSTSLIKSQTIPPALARVSGQLAVTERLLEQPAELILIPYRKGDKWGFCDKNRRIVIDCQYSYAAGFSQSGLATVYQNKKTTLIDKTGKPVTDVDCDWIDDDYYEGFCCVRKDKKYGLIDRVGNLMSLGFVFDNKVRFQEDLLVATFTYGWFKEQPVVLNIDFKQAMPNENLLGDFSMGLAPFFDEYAGEDKWLVGFIDTSGKVVIPATYEVDPDPLAIIYYDKFCFKGGVSQVCQREKWGVIDLNNKLIVPFDFEYIDIDEDARIIRAIVKLGGIETYFYDFLGNIYELPLTPCEHFSENLAVGVSNTKLFGFFNIESRIVIPATYECASSFSEGLAAVQMEGKWGFINKANEIIIPFIYSNTLGFSKNGLAKVKLNDKWGFIDRSGKVIIDFKYDMINEHYPNSVYRVSMTNKAQYARKGYIDEVGNEYWED